MIRTFKEVKVELADRHLAQKIRDKFKSSLSMEFKHIAMRETVRQRHEDNRFEDERPILPHDLHIYQSHHILPVQLGGTNDLDNLAWVHPRLHRKIHLYINVQTVGIVPGEKRVIKLPIKAGMIWTPN